SRCGASLSPGTLCLAAALNGLLSFGFLAAAIGTDYWYLIHVDGAERNGSSARDGEELSSHSGLWRLCEGKEGWGSLACSLPAGSAVPCHLLDMHRAFMILLPLSLILIIFGWICGIVGSLAQISWLLLFTGCYFLLGALLTLSGTSTYICYSKAAFIETVRMFDQQRFDRVHITFGWSLALAWLSFGTEGLAGILLLLAAQGFRLKLDAHSADI
uniref:Transmembrane protein 235 n=1 Tax=Naja naja TaxID=35670 RepID=A0A8C6XU89_NAJNA